MASKKGLYGVVITYEKTSKGTSIGRNPKTGEPVALSGKYVPHFKPGKDLRDRVNRGISAGNKRIEC